ncbi:TPA: ATP-binding protein, partial [Pluralibacter gergoviae]|nr:ATP-binding protein [Pluralibacter gergoviae]
MSDIKATPEPQVAASENVDGWVQAICRVAGHYRLSYSPGSV